MTEANVNLDVAKRLGHLLTADGYRPYYTRTTDTYLTTRARANICNDHSTSILVSIHQNASSNTSVDYSAALFFKSSDRRLARTVVRSTSVLAGHNHGVVHFASPMLMNSKMPATISEVLFMTATREGIALTKRSHVRQQQEAQAIYNGIVNYFAGSRRLRACPIRPRADLRTADRQRPLRRVRTVRRRAVLAGLATITTLAAGCGGRPPEARSNPPAPATTAAAQPSTVPPGNRAPSPHLGPTGAGGVPSRLAGTDWTRLPTDRRVVALTFDAGASAAGVAPILATLTATDVPATFFLTGRWTRTYPGQARRVAAAYPVSNHSLTHPHLPRLSAAAVRAQVTDAEAAIRSVTGRSPRRVFRFPYGERSARDIAIVNGLGYVAVRWTVDTLGWKGTSGGMTTDAVVRRVLDGLQPGEIVLMHVGANPDDGSTLDAAALPRVIREVRAGGYGFAGLEALTP